MELREQDKSCHRIMLPKTNLKPYEALVLITFSMFKLSLLTCQCKDRKILTGLNLLHCSKLKAEGIRGLWRHSLHWDCSKWSMGRWASNVGSKMTWRGIMVLKGGSLHLLPSHFFCVNVRVLAHSQKTSNIWTLEKPLDISVNLRKPVSAQKGEEESQMMRMWVTQWDSFSLKKTNT